MRRLVLVAAVFLVGGCGGAMPEAEGERVFTVAVSEDAARVSQRAGVDLERLVAESAAQIFSRLPNRGRIRIELRLDPSGAISEVGIGGFTGRTGNVFLSIDSSPPGVLRHALETWIPGVLAHELHHSSRIRAGPGYGNALGEGLVSEGLAEHFVDEVFPATPPRPWDSVLSKAQERALWRQAEPRLWFVYDYSVWFSGVGGSDIPRWAGYALGYRIVEAYLGDARSAADAVRTEAKTIVEPYARLVQPRADKAGLP